MEWIRKYCMAYLFFTVLCAFSANQKYQKYLHFFVRLILISSLMFPVISLWNHTLEREFYLRFQEEWNRMEHWMQEQVSQRGEVKAWTE